jgi:hypothetical protein
MARSLIVCVAAIASLVPLFASAALGPHATAGADYLSTSQNVDGSWGGTPTSLVSPIHATTVVTDVLRDVGLGGSPAVGSASSYLTGVAPVLTELIARRVIALAGTGVDETADVNALLTRQNLDGGFGSDMGFDSTVLDTSVALQALHAVGLPRALIAGGGVAAGTPTVLAILVPAGATQLRVVVRSLAGTMDVRIREGSVPTLATPFFHLTAAPVQIVITPSTPGVPLVAGMNFIRLDAAAGATFALDASVSVPGIDPSITLDAARWLVEAQNADGGFGFAASDEDSRVFFTAETVLALANVADPASAITFLAGRHRADGGFGDDPTSTTFETGMALAAYGATGTGIGGLIPSPIAHLTTTQSLDGSWVGDAYSTALAIRALDAFGEGGGPTTTTTTIVATTTTTSTTRTTTTSTLASTSTTATSSTSSTSTTSTSTTTSSTTSTSVPAAIEHFMLYKTKANAGSPKLIPFAPVELADEFGSSSYGVSKTGLLGLPAEVNGAGVVDADTHLREFKVKTVKGAAPVATQHVQIANQCNALRLEVSKPGALLVPAGKSLTSLPPAPGLGDHQLDHYLCYKAKVQTKLPDGTALPKFPKGMQLDVADQFQTRRYDLVKITRFCSPVDTSGEPVLLSGPNAGQPFPIPPSTIRHATDHLVCYQAKLASKHIAQTGCGATRPGDTGTAIVPKQPKHTPVSPIFVNDELAPEELASVQEAELCVPSSAGP